MRSKIFRTKSDRIFYIALMALPVLQFCVFYIYVNINSVIMAFQEYNLTEEGGVFTFVGLDNFVTLFSGEKLKQLLIMGKNSLILFCFTFFVGIPLALCFSYYIYKQKALSGLFKVILYLPSILSGVVVGLIYLYFMDQAVPAYYLQFTGEVMLPPFNDHMLGFSIFYTVFFGFGTNVLLYVGAMGKLSDSVIEAAQIDGANSVQEFIYVVLPQIFPTIKTFILTGLAALFTNQASMFTFTSHAPKSESTIGYYLYVQAKSEEFAVYTELAALGVALSVITSAITFTVRHILNKVDPMEN